MGKNIIMCDRKISIFQSFFEIKFSPLKIVKNDQIKTSTDSSWPEFSLSIVKNADMITLHSAKVQ